MVGLSDLGSIHTPPGHLHAPIYLDVPMFGHPLYVWMPPYVLDTSHMFGYPLYIWVPHTHLNAPCSPVYLYASRGYLHMIWGWGHLYTPY